MKVHARRYSLIDLTTIMFISPNNKVKVHVITNLMYFSSMEQQQQQVSERQFVTIVFESTQLDGS